MKKHIKRLEKHGYNVTFALSGWWIASKMGRTYKADTLPGLIRMVFN